MASCSGTWMKMRQVRSKHNFLLENIIGVANLPQNNPSRNSVIENLLIIILINSIRDEIQNANCYYLESVILFSIFGTK